MGLSKKIKAPVSDLWDTPTIRLSKISPNYAVGANFYFCWGGPKMMDMWTALCSSGDSPLPKGNQVPWAPMYSAPLAPIKDISKRIPHLPYSVRSYLCHSPSCLDDNSGAWSCEHLLLNLAFIGNSSSSNLELVSKSGRPTVDLQACKELWILDFIHPVSKSTQI